MGKKGGREGERRRVTGKKKGKKTLKQTKHAEGREIRITSQTEKRELAFLSSLFIPNAPILNPM